MPLIPLLIAGPSSSIVADPVATSVDSFGDRVHTKLGARVFMAAYTVPEAGIALGNVIEMLTIPSGYVVAEGFIHCTEKPAGSTCTMEVGVLGDYQNFVTSFDANKNDLGNAMSFGPQSTKGYADVAQKVFIRVASLTGGASTTGTNIITLMVRAYKIPSVASV